MTLLDKKHIIVLRYSAVNTNQIKMLMHEHLVQNQKELDGNGERSKL